MFASAYCEKDTLSWQGFFLLFEARRSASTVEVKGKAEFHLLECDIHQRLSANHNISVGEGCRRVFSILAHRYRSAADIYFQQALCFGQFPLLSNSIDKLGFTVQSPC